MKKDLINDCIKKLQNDTDYVDLETVAELLQLIPVEKLKSFLGIKLTDLEILRKLSQNVTDEDRELFDKVYHNLLFPLFKDTAEKTRVNFLELRDNGWYTKSEVSKYIEGSLQNFVQKKMRPYLEDLGYEIITYNPSYLVKISWEN
jgi:hypothetical protein